MPIIVTTMSDQEMYLYRKILCVKELNSEEINQIIKYSDRRYVQKEGFLAEFTWAHIAVRYGNKSLLKALMDAKVDLQVATRRLSDPYTFSTPFNLAILLHEQHPVSGYENIIKLFSEYFNDIENFNDGVKSCVDPAYHAKYILSLDRSIEEIFSYFEGCRKGFFRLNDLIGDFGQTMLHVAVERMDDNLIDALISLGASLTAENTEGHTPRQRAYELARDVSVSKDQQMRYATIAERLLAIKEAQDQRVSAPLTPSSVGEIGAKPPISISYNRIINWLAQPQVQQEIACALVLAGLAAITAGALGLAGIVALSVAIASSLMVVGAVSVAAGGLYAHRYGLFDTLVSSMKHQVVNTESPIHQCS